MIPFYIVTGWLGSGKTTLLKNILNKYGDKTRIAVIQNEFAPTGVDGKELENTGQPFKLIEVNNGSVFCVCQLNNFTEALEKLASDYSPDVIFLESSGLADPISIAEILNDTRIKDKIALKKIYTIIDAINFERTFQMMVRFKHQVMVADRLIINKTDCDDANTEKTLEQLKKWNPFAEVVQTSFCNIELNDLFDSDDIGKSRRFLPLVKAGSKPDMGVSFLRMHEKISKQQLLLFIEEIIPTSQRIKGFVNLKDGGTLAIQSVYDKFEHSKLEKFEGRTELIIFNNNYTPRDLQKLYKTRAIND